MPSRAQVARIAQATMLLTLVGACTKPDARTDARAASASVSVDADNTPAAASSHTSSEGADPSWNAGTGAPIRVAIIASKDGFVPEVAKFIQGRPAILDFTRTDDTTCVNAVRMPWMDKALPLPEDETVSIQIPDTSQDGEFQYGCWMKMVFGKVVIEPRADTKAPASSPRGAGG